MPSGADASCIIISIGAEWIKKEFSQCSEALKKLLSYLIHTNKPTLFYEAVSIADQKILVELHNHFANAGDEPFYIKGSTMLLISYFFNNLFKKRWKKWKGIMFFIMIR
ncbi:MAG: hypothetical protein WDO16_13800 [Bacteroidota bacterium]